MSPAEPPRFTVVVPTFRRPQLLARALDSVAAQTWEDWEAVVVDDADDAATRRLVAERSQRDPRLRYIARATAGGPAVARNAGIELARGEYIAFLDDDDELLPGMLSAVHRRIEAWDPPLGFLWCALRMVRDLPEGEALVEERTWGPHFDRPADAPPRTADEQRRAEYDASRIGTGFGLVVRRDLLREVGGLDDSLSFAEDTDLLLRLVATGEPFDALREVQVIVHRVGAESLSKSTPSAQRIASLERVRQRSEALLRRSPHLEAKLWETIGREHYRAGEVGPAWRWAARLLRHHPWTAHAWRMLARAALTRNRR
ncbi:MAG: glycosyltransferase [Acidobacteriota bacterium]|nr:glycosyltransferase [Acidobacteriota bacterium]